MELPEVKSPPLLSALVDVYKGLFYDVKLEFKDFETLCDRARCEGISFFTKTLPKLGKAFDSALSTGSFYLPCHFKRKWRGKEIPAFCGSLFSEVFTPTGQLKPDADPLDVRHIRQICYLAYKLVLPFEDSVVNETFDRFVEVDQSLSDQEFDDPGLISRMANLTNTVFEGYSWSDCDPRHGPGITSDVQITAKRETIPHPASRVRRHFGDDSWIFESERKLGTSIDNLVNMIASFLDISFEGRSCPVYVEPAAKVLAVPKDSRGPRIISAEPCSNQYIQQGIMNWTVERLENHSLTRGRINFTDQSVNQILALTGSRNQEWSTLDLKEASDRVSLKLVKLVFSGTGEYLSDMLACRTTHTELKYPDGTKKLVELQKFAPMGSALCFTTLAWIVYSAIVCYFSRTMSVREAMSLVTVYGDDVCVRSAFAEDAIRALESIGLLINRDKSFIISKFLESCGVDAFDGVDVTPIRLKQYGSKSDLPPRSPVLVSMVAGANNLYLKGYHGCAETLYRQVEKMIGLLPYGTMDSSYLCRVARDFGPHYNDEKYRVTKHGLVRGINAWCVKAVKTSFDETGYGRLRRILPLLGQDIILPGYGKIDLPRQTKLVRKFVRTN